jgi:plasmid stability protein
MATLTIRNFPDAQRDALKARAAKSNRSMEAEVKEILGAALSKDRDESDFITTWLRRAQEWGAQPGEELVIPERPRDDWRETVTFE